MNHLNKEEITRHIHNLVESIKEENDIVGVILYGSFLTREYSRDVDIAIAFKRNTQKERMFKKRIKLSGEFPDYLDIQIFNLLPLTLQKEVLKGKIMYMKEEMYEIAYQVLLEYEDFERFRDEYVKRYMLEH